ncbi:uncharacterized protein [Enoplosus armatus]|uniref:uncharacterized protein n=1 Tax=Enoplosus armatus TaxID=215367 RepID=UPI0039952EBF
MPRTTVKQAIVDTLKNLSKDNFILFRHHLRDRRGEPRISLSDVEGKSLLKITDLLVSKFTEPTAVLVTLEILRQMDCNDESATLYSKTKACVDKGEPTFPRTSTGELERKPSQEALNQAAKQWPLRAAGRGGPPVKKPEEVKAEAEACVLSEGGDPSNDRLLLSRFMIQFGKYKGQTFKWLLENDVGYTAILVASHQMEREHTMSQSPLMVNKDSFTQYAIAYPEVLREIKFHHDKEKERAWQSGQGGKALVGFGKHRSETLQDLYESKDPDKISYVDYLRKKESTCTRGSRMDITVRYILQRDRKKAAARKRPGRKKRV